MQLMEKGMIETAKKHANAPVPGSDDSAEKQEPAEAAEPEAPTDTSPEDASGPKVDTVPAPTTTGEGEGEAGEDGEDSIDPVQIEMRRERAKRILKALGAR